MRQLEVLLNPKYTPHNYMLAFGKTQGTLPFYAATKTAQIKVRPAVLLPPPPTPPLPPGGHTVAPAS